MKKITLLFATLLAMSGMAFGQKEGKVVWEKNVGKSPSSIGGSSSGSLRISPNGNSLVGSDGFVYKYDANGNVVWKINDFYKNKSGYTFVDIRNKNYTLLQCFDIIGSRSSISDSVIYFDREYNFLKGFATRSNNNSFYVTADDGIFYSDSKNKLYKYDLNGKEEWNYQGDYYINMVTSNPPYVGIEFTPTESRKLVIFNKQGKKTGETEPQTFRQVFTSNDQGFWLVNNDFEYIKFDSTGKQTAKYSEFKNIYNFITIPSVFADNSLLLNIVKDNEVLVIKVAPNGNTARYSIPATVKFRDYYTTLPYKIISSQNKVMYALRLQETEQAEADIKYKIGVVNFDNPSSSWNKDVSGGASNGIYGNAFTFEVDNTFFQVYSKPDNPPIKTFKVYDIDGSLKWESPFVINSPIQNIQGWRLTDNYLYTTALYSNGIEKNGLVKVSISDGKMIWKKENITIYNFIKDIQIAKNETILYNKDNIYKIASLNADGSDNWIHQASISKDYFSSENIFFKPTDDNKLIVLLKDVGTNNNYLETAILRKISPCTDIIATATANKTEACPTEKVKLSIPKQEGVTYQWQRDGKDVPELKDAVHDVGESGTYTVTVKDAICQNQAVSNALKITIRSLATAQITAPKTTFCEGDKTTITAQTNGTYFQWQKDEKDIPNATTGIYEVTQAGNYRVGVRDDKCPQVGYSNVYTIITKPTPEAKIFTDIKGVIYEPFTVKMTANSGTGLAYQWLKDDAIIPNETTANYEAKKSGKYNVSVSKDGCTKISEALNISIQIALANEGEIGEDVVKIYPNPSRGEFKIVLPKSLQNADIQLFDLLGRERTLIHIGEQAQADGLVQGTYFLRIHKGEKTVTSKLIVE